VTVPSPARFARSGRPASDARTPRDTGAASWASTPDVRRRMQRQPTRDTAPELQLRRALHAAGLRYRVDAPPLPGLRRRADLVFGPARVAVFVDGCFWHGCPEHGARTPHANAGYWADKVRRNRERDADTGRRLQDAGWLALRVWEHEDVQQAARLVDEAVRSRRPRPPARRTEASPASGPTPSPTAVPPLRSATGQKVEAKLTGREACPTPSSAPRHAARR
jgi:DNA mismatch endonuclease (patch repair protein)